MRLIRFTGLLLIICGTLLTLVAALTGGLEFLFVFMFIPTFLAKTPMAIGGVLMIFFGIVAMAITPFLDIGSLEDRKMEMASKGAQSERLRKKSAGVLLIGPIPIVWGSDDRSAMWATAVAVAIVMVLMIVLLIVV